ncbi:MAG: cyclase family protein [Acholeplasmatales bacterium]|nr:MAG: cyclase family protein [Acholeplasmatales bacterium]
MIYDISMTVHPDMAVYKNKPEKKPVFTVVRTFAKEGGYETDVSMNLHTGTHVDYPLHVLEDGDNSDTENLETLIGEAMVLDLSHVKTAITADDLKSYAVKPDSFVLLKTVNSETDAFDFDFVYLAEDAARHLAACKVRGVGIDALGIERNQAGQPTHKALLKQGIVILEGLRLATVREGYYTMICLPLKIQGVEASPARVILTE